jgi:MFS transporter, DHA1 family, inner membrane transport protein
MKHVPAPASTGARFAPTALMLGNFVTACSVLAPAGMLVELSVGLDVSIRTAGLLITFGAIVLCIGSPLTAWLTSRIERRLLLAATLAVLAVSNFASAFAQDYASLMAIRLFMLAIGVIFTPQAAGTAALIVPEERRGGTIAYVFLGWSLAAAVGLPAIKFIASRYGWHSAYLGIGAMGCLSFLLLMWRLPRGLIGAPVDLKTWATVGRNPMILLLLLITTLQMSGQFVVFTYMGPLLARLTAAGPDQIALLFACYGACGVTGAAIAARIVDSWGGWKTSLLFMSVLLAGQAGWALSAGFFPPMAASVAIWGIGFASTNSMQQVRLVAAAPALASASVSLNTSVLYIGQANGSAIGGFLYANEMFHAAGYVAAGLVGLAVITVILTRPGRARGG